MTAEAAAAEHSSRNQGRKKGHRRRETTSEGRQMGWKNKVRSQRETAGSSCQEFRELSMG